MNDNEFIELLNMYVDREISPADAQRLEAEVAKDPRRRAVYDEYCRMQKACSMLSEDSFRAPAAQTAASLVSFPSASPFRLGTFASGLAAAAAIAVAFFGLRGSAPVAAQADATAQVQAVAASSAQKADGDAMKPVFFVRLPEQTGQSRALAETDAASRVAQLSWISDIHLSPVPAAPGSDLLIGSKGELKAAAASDVAIPGQDQEPLEMTAFRFQR